MQARLKNIRTSITRQLRALAHPAFVLLLAVCIVIAATPVCIIQCQTNLSWPLQIQPAATSEGMPVSTNCFQALGSSLPTPLAPLASIHDILLAAPLVLAGFVLLQRVYALPLPLLLSRGTTPPTPPPRHRAA